MSNFDDIFSGQGDKPRWNEQPFDKEAWAAKKQEERKELYPYPYILHWEWSLTNVGY